MKCYVGFKDNHTLDTSYFFLLPYEINAIACSHTSEFVESIVQMPVFIHCIRPHHLKSVNFCYHLLNENLIDLTDTSQRLCK
jgi:hypothetical protein